VFSFFVDLVFFIVCVCLRPGVFNQEIRNNSTVCNRTVHWPDRKKTKGESNIDDGGNPRSERRTVLFFPALPDPCAASCGSNHIDGAAPPFPYPMYSKWFNEYHNAHPDIQNNLSRSAQWRGIRQVLAGTVGFSGPARAMTPIAASQSK